MAALIREPPRGDGPARRVSLRASADELDVSKIARASGAGGGHRQAAGFSSNDSIEEITEFIRREFAAARNGVVRALDPERARPLRQARRPLVVRDRARSCASRQARGRATRGRSTRSRPGSCSSCSGASRRRRSASSGSRSGTRRRSTCRGRRRRAIPRARSSTSTSRRPLLELEARLDALRGEVDLKIPAASAVKIGGERAYKLHRRGVAVEMPTRRTTVYELELEEYDGAGRAALDAPQLRRLRARDRRGARRPLREPAPDERRPLRRRGRRSRSGSSTPTTPSRRFHEGRAHARRARCRAAGGRARDLRRRASRAPARDRDARSTPGPSRPSSRSTRIRAPPSETGSSC